MIRSLWDQVKTTTIPGIFFLSLFALLYFCSAAHSQLQFSTESSRKSIELSIYKNSNLTLIQETRVISLKNGKNKIYVHWGNSRIDPSSLKIEFPSSNGQVRVKELSYPPEKDKQGVWVVESEEQQQVVFELSYLSLGYQVDTFYRGEYEEYDQSLRLKGILELKNSSDKQLNRAVVNVILGKVQLLENMAKQIRNWYRPGSDDRGTMQGDVPRRDRGKVEAARSFLKQGTESDQSKIRSSQSGYKWILSLDERITLQSDEEIRVPFLRNENIPTDLIYEYRPRQTGADHTMKFLNFRNDTSSNFENRPLPSGEFILYSKSGQNRFSTVNSLRIPYLSHGDDMKLKLGESRQVEVNRRVMNQRSENFRYNSDGKLTGWEKLKSEKTTLTNNRSTPVKVKIFKKFNDQYWSIENSSHPFRKKTFDSLLFSFEVSPGTTVNTTQKYRFKKGSLRKNGE